MWYNFKLSSFFKMKNRICKESIHFYKFIFIKNWLRRKNLTYWGKFNHFSLKVAKKNIQKIICMKKIFWGKRTCMIIYSNACGSFDLILTLLLIFIISCVSWMLTNIITKSFFCFQKCNRNSSFEWLFLWHF